MLKGCIKTGKSGDFSVLKVFRSKFKELKVSYKAKKLDSSFSVSKTFDKPLTVKTNTANDSLVVVYKQINNFSAPTDGN